jgi:hypothetical protein
VITPSIHYSLTIVGWLVLGFVPLGWAIGAALEAWTPELKAAARCHSRATIERGEYAMREAERLIAKYEEEQEA